MSGELLVRDLAVVLVMAAIVAYVFQRLRQPIIIGYIIVGIVIGPYTPLIYLSQPEVFGSLAELGVILLLFGIGLTFLARRLMEFGRVSLVVASTEINLMISFSVVTGVLLG